MNDDKIIYNETFDELCLDESIGEKIINRQFKKRTKRLPKWVAIVFLIIILGTTTSVMAKVCNFSFLKLFSSNNEAGYEIQVKINPIAYTEFKGDIRESQNIVQEQIQRYESYMSWNPLEYTKYFDSLEDAFSYAGLEDISYVELKDDVPNTLCVFCNDDGNIKHILIMTEYEIDENNVQIWYYVFSDLMENPYEEIVKGIANGELMEEGFVTSSKNEDSIIFESVASGKNNYQISSELLASGMQIPIITSEGGGNRIETAEAYFSIENIVYSIHVASDAENGTTAEETLLEILKNVN